MRPCYFCSIIPLQSFTPSASQLISYWSAVTALHPPCIRHYLLSQYTAHWALFYYYWHTRIIITSTIHSLAANLGWPEAGLSLIMWLKWFFLLLLVGLVGLVIVKDVGAYFCGTLAENWPIPAMRNARAQYESIRFISMAMYEWRYCPWSV